MRRFGNNLCPLGALCVAVAIILLCEPAFMYMQLSLDEMGLGVD